MTAPPIFTGLTIKKLWDRVRETYNTASRTHSQALSQAKQNEATAFGEDPLSRVAVGAAKTASQIPAAVARGAHAAGTEMARTVAEAGAVVARKTPIGEAVMPGYDALYDEVGGAKGITAGLFDDEEAERDEFYGKRSDDFIASFTEDVSQFVSGAALLGRTLPSFVQGATRLATTGALVDAVAFNPYDEQLAELVNKHSNIPGIEFLSRIASVEEDDSPVVARFKRSAAGYALGATVDGVVAAARIARYQRRLRQGVTPIEERDLKTAIAVEEGIIGENQAAGEVGPQLKLRENPDGTSTIIEERTGTIGPTFESSAEAKAQLASFERAVVPVTKIQPDVVANTIRERMELAVAERGKLTDEMLEDLADEVLRSVPVRDASKVILELARRSDIQSVASDIASAHSRNLGQRIAALDVILESRPHDLVAQQEAIHRVQELLTFDDEMSWILGEQGRALRRRGRRLAGEGSQIGEGRVNEFDADLPESILAESDVAGMSVRKADANAITAANVRDVTRMYRMAGGSPKSVQAAVHASRVVMKTGNTNAALEVFVNSILSGPATPQTVLASGLSIGAFEAAGRLFGGLFSGNTAQAREGVDILYGMFSHLSDNFRVARLSLNEGKSVINPVNQYHAIDGTLGEVIRTPASVMTAADEFTRVTQYRAFVRAKSLRQGRELGLKGNDLAQKVEADLRAAFDPETGIATIPEALQYAERSTLSGPLGMNTLGGDLQRLMNNNPALQFLSPFTKTATNMYRFTTMHTPGLSGLSREAQQIFAKGGEEAAALRAKQAMAGALIMTGVGAALAGNLTGRAPADPQMRQLWLKDHQEYSVKIGDNWVSYRRTDPFGIMLGLASDFVQFGQQMDTQDPSVQEAAYAMMAAVSTSMLTPTYLKGYGEFLEALNGDPQAWSRFSRNFLGGFMPNAIASLNTDPYLRETQGILDGLAAKTPFWSQTLDPRYDVFGDPIMNGGITNRVQMFRVKPASENVEAELLELGRGFEPFAKKTPEGIDLSDRKAFDNGTGVSPYRRMMELIASPDHTGKTLRQRVEEMVQSDYYKNLSSGTAEFATGGTKHTVVGTMRAQAYRQAYGKVLREYPLLMDELRRVRQFRGSSYSGGEEALMQARELLGPSRQNRKRPNNRLRQR